MDITKAQYKREERCKTYNGHGHCNSRLLVFEVLWHEKRREPEDTWCRQDRQAKHNDHSLRSRHLDDVSTNHGLCPHPIQGLPGWGFGAVPDEGSTPGTARPWRCWAGGPRHRARRSRCRGVVSLARQASALWPPVLVPATAPGRLRGFGRCCAPAQRSRRGAVASAERSTTTVPSPSPFFSDEGGRVNRWRLGGLAGRRPADGGTVPGEGVGTCPGDLPVLGGCHAAPGDRFAIFPLFPAAHLALAFPVRSRGPLRPASLLWSGRAGLPRRERGPSSPLGCGSGRVSRGAPSRQGINAASTQPAGRWRGRCGDEPAGRMGTPSPRSSVR